VALGLQKVTKLKAGQCWTAWLKLAPTTLFETCCALLVTSAAQSSVSLTLVRRRHHLRTCYSMTARASQKLLEVVEAEAVGVLERQTRSLQID